MGDGQVKHYNFSTFVTLMEEPLKKTALASPAQSVVQLCRAAQCLGCCPGFAWVRVHFLMERFRN